MRSSIVLGSRAPVVLLAALASLSLGCARGEVHADARSAAATADSPAVHAQADAPAPEQAPALIDATGQNALRAPELAAMISPGSLARRFVSASALFLGVVYQDGPLGEGAAGGVDSDPRVDFDRADCVTYLEQSLALALCAGNSAASPRDFLTVLDRIRYRDGRVDFETRNHYMARDWVPSNAWLVHDVTDSLAPGVAVSITRAIDRATFLRERGARPRPGVDDAAALTMRIIPREAQASVAPAIASGDLVFWAGKKDGIDIVHTGLAVRDAQGRLLFRHASSKAGRVTEEPFADYAARATFASGFMVLRLREDAR